MALDSPSSSLAFTTHFCGCVSNPNYFFNPFSTSSFLPFLPPLFSYASPFFQSLLYVLVSPLPPTIVLLRFPLFSIPSLRPRFSPSPHYCSLTLPPFLNPFSTFSLFSIPSLPSPFPSSSYHCSLTLPTLFNPYVLLSTLPITFVPLTFPLLLIPSLRSFSSSSHLCSLMLPPLFSPFFFLSLPPLFSYVFPFFKSLLYVFLSPLPPTFVLLRFPLYSVPSPRSPFSSSTHCLFFIFLLFLSSFSPFFSFTFLPIVSFTIPSFRLLFIFLLLDYACAS
ncbi:unnamed protein product [Acanthosepion pharaonis]|uniref:Uncharacterized protein n=1 Tax=Acanthosepion pharaonis TaxID=158019 RepID=A0A812BTT5_ACAPH|nr:unnamed protein product [Sepia pharaonis]